MCPVTRTPLASAQVDLFVRADLAIQLLDALWLQGELTDAGHAERTGAMRRAPLSVLGGIQRAHARYRALIEALYRQRDGGLGADHQNLDRRHHVPKD